MQIFAKEEVHGGVIGDSATDGHREQRQGKVPESRLVKKTGIKSPFSKKCRSFRNRWQAISADKVAIAGTFLSTKKGCWIDRISHIWLIKIQTKAGPSGIEMFIESRWMSLLKVHLWWVTSLPFRVIDWSVLEIVKLPVIYAGEWRNALINSVKIECHKG